jgi:branched-chain amino acid aminotransferase
LEADEVFCSGTAVNVTPIGKITTDETFQVIHNNICGHFTKQIGEILTGIRNETIEDQFGWLYPVF